MPDKYIVYGKGDDLVSGNHPRITLGKFIWDNLIQHDPDSIAEVKSKFYFSSISNGDSKKLCTSF